MHLRFALASLLVLTACASPSAMTDISPSPTAALLLGEQHDAPEHHQLQRQMVQALAGRGVLAALALEMAETGTSTAGLSPQASEADVRRALRWDDRAWPWASYAPAVMAAVSAGAPVVGANLPREQVRGSMADATLDTLLPGPALKAQQQAIRIGHCGLLPEHQIAPMTRVQVARDRAMAATLAQLVQPGKTVVLIAGAGHVDPAVGVPYFLPVGVVSKAVVLPASPVPRRDYCEDMKRSLKPAP